MKNKAPARGAARGTPPAARRRRVQPGPVPRRAKGSGVPPRARGRPAKGSGLDARAALLAAARELFVRYGYRAVSARQIARLAGVDPSLLAYHFSGKHGLYREVLGLALEPVFAAARSLGEPDARATADAGDGGEPIERVLAAYMRVLAANPWIPGLIVREVLVGGGGYRAQFVRDFPSQIAPLALESIRGATAAGRYRAGLDPRLVLVSCIGMAVMPFLGAPVFEKLFGDGFLRDPEPYIAHTRDMLRNALQARRP